MLFLLKRSKRLNSTRRWTTCSGDVCAARRAWCQCSFNSGARSSLRGVVVGGAAMSSYLAKSMAASFEAGSAARWACSEESAGQGTVGVQAKADCREGWAMGVGVVVVKVEDALMSTSAVMMACAAASSAAVAGALMSAASIGTFRGH